MQSKTRLVCETPLGSIYGWEVEVIPSAEIDKDIVYVQWDDGSFDPMYRDRVRPAREGEEETTQFHPALIAAGCLIWGLGTYAFVDYVLSVMRG